LPISRILAALLGLSLAQGGFAWGPEGHRMVGEIAERYLNPKARSRILDLLEADRLADGQPSGRHTLGEVVNWADEIKDFEWGKRRASWHYDDVPLCEAAEYSKYCRGGRCASAQLARQIELLGDQRGRTRQRNEALKWVVHLMGDLFINRCTPPTEATAVGTGCRCPSSGSATTRPTAASTCTPSGTFTWCAG
jgi:hypothetical protein